MAAKAHGDTPLFPMPFKAEDITLGWLNALLGTVHPDAAITALRVVDSKAYGDGMVSTAARVSLELDFAPGSPTLPRQVVLKLARSPDYRIGPIYENEVGFYNGLRQEMAELETPVALGGAYDPESEMFALLLEDLSVRGVTFPHAAALPAPEQIPSLVETLANLHVSYWNSPRFAGDLAGMQTHLAGPVAGLMDGPVRRRIAGEIANERFKCALVQKLGTDADRLFAGLKAVQRHQATLPQTVLHGDTHIGNTYVCPDGRMGLLDWQLTVRGTPMHDVSYALVTGLETVHRRAMERDLLAYYLDRLAAAGVSDVPSFDSAFTEYRRAIHWGLYIGWLTTPVANYGWEINVLNHIRLVAAYEDHEVAGLVEELL